MVVRRMGRGIEGGGGLLGMEGSGGGVMVTKRT